MDHTLIPSFEHIALVKITVLLWNQADIRTKIFWCPFSSNDKFGKWREVEKAVIEKVSLLSLPKPLKKRVLGYVKPIGKQIFSWLECHENLYFGILQLPNELCWNFQGFLDSKKTAEALIKGKTVHIITRYKLACTYCLEKDIPELWNEFPDNLKKEFFYREISGEFERFEYVISLWTNEIKGDLLAFCNKLYRFHSIAWLHPGTSLYLYAFEFAAQVGNKAAAEFFLKKLKPWEREESLARCTESLINRLAHTNVSARCSNVLNLLMAEMHEEQQLQIYVRHPLTMLKCLLEWPWQTFFVETADRVWDFLSVKDYNDILNQIVLKVKDGFQDWNYMQLFGQLWQKGTSPQKRYVLDDCIRGPLLTNLFQIKDFENITLLVQDATVLEKQEIIFYRPDISSLLIYNNEWNLLKLLVGHCLSSREIVGKFQKEFLERDLSSLAKEDMIEEKAMLKGFLKSLSSLVPMYAMRTGSGLHGVDWVKEEVKYTKWKSIRVRRSFPKQQTKGNGTFF